MRGKIRESSIRHVLISLADSSISSSLWVREPQVRFFDCSGGGQFTGNNPRVYRWGRAVAGNCGDKKRIE